MKELAIVSKNPNGAGGGSFLPDSGANTIHIGNLASNGIPTGGLSAVANILQTAIALVFLFATIFFLFMLIYSGFTWMTSVGDKQKLQQARQRLTYAIIGIAIVLMSLFIVNLFGTFFNISDILNLPGS